MHFWDSYTAKARTNRISRGKLGSSATRKAEKDYHKYGHKKTAFISNKAYVNQHRKADTLAAQNKVVKQQHKKPQVARGPVSGIMDALSAPVTGTTSMFSSLLHGEKRPSKLFDSFVNGVNYMMPGRHGDKNKVHHGSGVFDAWQDFWHNNKRLSLNDRLMLNMGQAKLVGNKLGDGGGTKIVAPDGSDIRNTLTYKVNRGVDGFLIDTIVDPLNLIGGEPAKAVGKVFHGSGASVNRLKSVAKELQTTKTLDTIDKLWKMPEKNRSNILSRGSNPDNVYNIMKSYKDLYGDIPDDQLREHAKDVANTFNETYQHLPSLSKSKSDISVGLGHHSFATKRMQALNKKIISDDRLRKIGDYTIAPYWNELTERLTTSRVGLALSTHGKMLKKIRSSFNSDVGSFAVLDDILSGYPLALKNNTARDTAYKFAEQFKLLTPKEQEDFIVGIEDGTFLKADNLVAALRNASIDSKTGEVYDFPEGRPDVTQVKNQLRKKDHDLKLKKKTYSDYRENGLQALSVLAKHDLLNISPNSYLFRQLYGESADLGTDERKVLGVLNFIMNDDILKNVNIQDTMYSELERLESKLHAFDKGNFYDGNFSKSPSYQPVFKNAKDYNNTVLGVTLLKKQLQAGRPSSKLIETYTKVFGADSLYDLLKKRASIGNLDADDIMKYKIENTKDNKDLLYRAYKSYRDRTTAIFDKTLDNPDIDHDLAFAEADSIFELVDEKVNAAIKTGKYANRDDAYKAALSTLDDKIKSGILRNYGKTDEGQADFLRFTSGTSLFDEYNLLKNARTKKVEDMTRRTYERSLEDQRVAIEQMEKESALAELDEAQLLNLRKLQAIESIIAPNTKKPYTDRVIDALPLSRHLEELEKIYKEWDDALNRFGGSGDSSKFKLASQFVNEMKRVAESEVRNGELKPEQAIAMEGKYFPHEKTNEAKAILNQGKEFKNNGGYSGKFGSAGSHKISRTSDLNVFEANKAFKEKNGVDLFKTNLAEAYLSRVLSSNKTISGDEAVKYLFDKFSRDFNPDDLKEIKYIDGRRENGIDYESMLKGNHTLSMPYKRLNNIITSYINNQISIEASRAANDFANSLDIIRSEKGKADQIYENVNLNQILSDVIYTKNATEQQRDMAKKQLHSLIDYFDKHPDMLKHPDDASVENLRNKLYSLREQAKSDSSITDSQIKMVFDAFKDAYDKREKSRLHGNEAYAQLHEMFNEINKMGDDINDLDEAINTLQGNIDNLNTDLLSPNTIENLSKTYKSTWLKQNESKMFDDMKTKILDDLFGKIDDKDKTVRQRRATFTPNIPVQKLTNEQANKLSKIYIGKDFFSELSQFDNEIMDMVNVMSRSQEIAGRSALLNFYDNFLMLKYKQLNTVIQPAFHVQNALGNAYLTFLGTSASALKPSNIKAAHNILSGSSPERVITLGGKEYKYRELLEYAKQMGVIDESFTRFDLAKGNNSEVVDNILTNSALKKFRNITTPFSKNTTIWQKLNSVNPLSRQDLLTQVGDVIGSNIETTQRMNLFLASLDEGMGMREAVKNVNDYMFDYSDLTNFEKTVLKRIIPFYTYMRKNIPMELKKLFTEPQKFTPFAYLENEATDNMDEPIEDSWRNRWRQNYIPFPGDSGYGIDLKLPYEQLDRLDFLTMNKDGKVVPSLMENGFEPRALGMTLGSTTPFIKTPLELAIGTNQYVDMPIYENGTPSKNDFIKYLMQQTIPGNIATDVQDIQNISPYIYNGKSEEANKQITDEKKKNAVIHAISSNLGFPVGHIYDMGNFKNNTIVGKNNFGLPYVYRSYLPQEQIDKIYKDNDVKLSEENKKRNSLNRTSAYKAYSKYMRDTGKPVPSFKKWQEDTYWVNKNGYEQYVQFIAKVNIDRKAHNKRPIIPMNYKKWYDNHYAEWDEGKDK